jgi:NAD(P)-dependent dehydrogenase (short-subunit alcohol dehydrogenase family)
VVNDIGSMHAPGPGTAESVVREIVALGGKAVADTNSVATEDGASAIIKTALEAFGGVDIVVNNAGICNDAPIDVMTGDDFRRIIEVNLLGTIWVSRAVWPHMSKKGAGRIVNITSGAMLGFALQGAYAASKGGVFSFTRSLAAEGKAFGIKVNSVAPAAFTRMVIGAREEDCITYTSTKDHMPAELVSPVVAYLCHETCPVTGECIEGMGGSVRRLYMAMTPGFADRALTIEKVAAQWDEVMAGTAESMVPAGLVDSREWHMKPYKPMAKAAT